MQIVISSLGMLRRFGQQLGPYLMLEILLPGGTLLALLLFLYQRRKLRVGRVARRPLNPPAGLTQQSQCRIPVPPIDYMAKTSR
jgi:hypothetical protein